MRTIVGNEAGIPFPITGVKLGYRLWLASIVGASIGALATPYSVFDPAPVPGRGGSKD